jgi:hypothetical protein
MIFDERTSDVMRDAIWLSVKQTAIAIFWVAISIIALARTC